MATYDVLIMGASYGSLLATKLLFGGHRITMVCLPAEIEAFNSEGAHIRLPIRGRKDPIELDSRDYDVALEQARAAVSIKEAAADAAALQIPIVRAGAFGQLELARAGESEAAVTYDIHSRRYRPPTTQNPAG